MIVKATIADAPVIAQLAIKMWDSHTLDELTAEFSTLLSNSETAVFLCVEKDAVIGFAQCQLRHDYVEGTVTTPVAYLEGVFVEQAHRKQGHGRKLIDSCVQWAKQNGCAEFASDCELENYQSLAFHLATGFQEANRVICFVRKI